MVLSPDDSAARLLACLQQALGHELPNQLIALQGLARLLLTEEGPRLSDEGRQTLERMATGARRAHDLVAALAALVRLERDRPPAEPVALDEILSEAVAEAKQLCSDLTVVYDWDRTAPLLAVPRSAFRQVLVHLLRQLAPAARVEVGVSSQRIELRLVSGEGSRPDPRLFEPFALTGGTGLEGFAVCQFAAAWGGAVRREEGPGLGFTLIVTAPHD